MTVARNRNFLALSLVPHPVSHSSGDTKVEVDVIEYARTVASAADFSVSGCREYRKAFRRESQPVMLN